jgi:hypothetical protein
MSLREVKWLDLPHVPDDRGVLTSIESAGDVPFDIRRVFFLHGVLGERGAHAHRDTQQVLLAAAGAFKLHVSDGDESADYSLCDPNRALYVPPMTWVRLYDFAQSAVCLVLADTHYDDGAYIRTWEEFRAARLL